MAEQVLTNFIRALRSADVRVSTAEAIDAANAVKLIGYADRARLADTLRCVLAKSPAEKLAHDRLFELYFSRAAPSEPSETSAEREDGDAPKDMLDLIDAPDETDTVIALEAAAETAGLQDIRFSTQVPYLAQQMMKAMGVDRLERQMMDAFAEKSVEGEARARELIDGRADMFARARDHARRAFETYGAGATAQFHGEILSEKRLTQLDRRDLHRMRGLVEKMARRLAEKHSRRRRKARRGKLDVRRTLRANAAYDGAPFELIWKETRRDRPKIVCVCDVSGSVAQVVRFFLMLVYSLADVVPDIESFAFSGRLQDVGDILEADDFTPAMDKIIRAIGMSSTDYGQSLSDLYTDHWSVLDRRTTLIVLGDGRSNHGDPRIDLFQQAAARVKRLVWLCPEPYPLWGSGDSEMLRYAPFCTQAMHVKTLKDLERVIDEVLAAYN